MASGTLGQSAPAATTNTTIYTVPSGKVATFNVSICNTNTTSVTIRLSISSTSTPSTSEYVEYNTTIPASGVLERSGLMASDGKLIVVYASATNVAFNVYGYEE